MICKMQLTISQYANLNYAILFIGLSFWAKCRSYYRFSFPYLWMMERKNIGYAGMRLYA